MKFLNLDLVKQQCRIEQDFHDEDELLEMYADSAEVTIAQYLNRGKTVEDLIDSLKSEYGEIPAALYHAGLLLVDVSYQFRSPISVQNVYNLPTFDILVKPYMKL